MNREIEEQRYGRNKNTSVNFSYIESGEYRRKFDAISNNIELNRLLYKLAKKMLKHRSGTLYEDMYWIDLDTLEVIAEEINMQVEESIVYSRRTENIIKNHKNVMTIHTHPNSFPPSIADFNSNSINKYVSGIIICHDGTIYQYSANEELEEVYYDLRVAKRQTQGYNEIEAQRLELEEISQRFDIKFQEVTVDEIL